MSETCAEVTVDVAGEALVVGPEKLDGLEPFSPNALIRQAGE
jgi:hypothetical protein